MNCHLRIYTAVKQHSTEAIRRLLPDRTANTNMIYHDHLCTLWLVTYEMGQQTQQQPLQTVLSLVLNSQLSLIYDQAFPLSPGSAMCVCVQCVCVWCMCSVRTHVVCVCGVRVVHVQCVHACSMCVWCTCVVCVCIQCMHRAGWTRSHELYISIGKSSFQGNFIKTRLHLKALCF